MPSNTDDGIEVVARAIQAAKDKWCEEAGEWNADIVPDDLLAQAAIAAYESHLIRDKGMVVVPRIPTEAMAGAGQTRHWGSDRASDDEERENVRDIYRAMIAAASPTHSATKSE